MIDNPMFFASDSVVRESYLGWLETIGGAYNVDLDKHYNCLFSALHQIPFNVIIDRDNNRLCDAKNLREAFKEDTRYAIYDAIDEMPISFLEILISLALRMEFIISASEDIDETPKWVWLLLINLNLDVFDDSTWDDNSEMEVIFIAQRVMDRLYDVDGYGGFFPLKDSREDQREVELWYQLNAYLNENF